MHLAGQPWNVAIEFAVEAFQFPSIGVAPLSATRTLAVSRFIAEASRNAWILPHWD